MHSKDCCESVSVELKTILCDDDISLKGITKSLFGVRSLRRRNYTNIHGVNVNCG